MWFMCSQLLAQHCSYIYNHVPQSGQQACPSSALCPHLEGKLWLFSPPMYEVGKCHITWCHCIPPSAHSDHLWMMLTAVPNSVIILKKFPKFLRNSCLLMMAASRLHGIFRLSPTKLKALWQCRGMQPIPSTSPSIFSSNLCSPEEGSNLSVMGAGAKTLAVYSWSRFYTRVQ